VILAGVRSLTIHDRRATSLEDLAAQFYLTEEDVGTNRAEACKDKLQELNGAVSVAASTAELTEEFLKGFNVRVRSRDMHGVTIVGASSCIDSAHIASDQT
jgi:ubiquitin-activating enzyme E1